VTLIGTYVRTFSEATHALPDGMHMNADYPFVLPKIEHADGETITIRGRYGRTATLMIERDRDGDFATLAQSSTFEKIYRRRPRKFRLKPFRAKESS
jgi:hypothetical protein